MKSGTKKGKTGLIILLILFACIFLISSGSLLRYYMEGFRSRKEFESLSAAVAAADGQDEEFVIDLSGDTGEARPREIMAKYRELHEQNPDLAGWLRVDGTNIDYPVMFKGMDHIDYYLHRGFDQSYSYRGCLFLKEDCDLEKPSDVLVVYGHNMKDGSMFGQLKRFENPEFREAHPVFEMDTLYETRRYEIISVFRTKVETGSDDDFNYWRFVDAEGKADFDDYVQELKKRSLYEIDATASYGDKLIELSTCEYSSRDSRFVVVGRQIR